jgi:hypothetical protein
MPQQRAVKTRLVMWRDEDSGTPYHLFYYFLPAFSTLDILLTKNLLIISPAYEIMYTSSSNRRDPMAKNLPSVMTFAQACEIFTLEILPFVQREYEQDGIPDYPARRQEWCNWTDGLCKDGQISDWQYDNWGHPPCNG